MSSQQEEQQSNNNNNNISNNNEEQSLDNNIIDNNNNSTSDSLSTTSNNIPPTTISLAQTIDNLNLEENDSSKEEQVDVSAGYESGEENPKSETPQYITIKVPKSAIKYNIKPMVIGESGIVFHNAQDLTYYTNRKLKNPSLTVWILTANASNILYANKRIFEAGWKKNIQVRVMEISKFEIVVTQQSSNTILYEGSTVELPDVVIPRLGARIDYFGMAVLRQFEKIGKPLVLNPAEGIEIARDKLYTLQQLSAYGLPFPKTMIAKFPLDLDSIERNFEYPIILKKSSGSQGKGVMLIQNREQLSDLSDMIDSTKPLIFQEFIKKSQGKDIRVIVIGGKAIGAMMRVAKKGFKANFHQGGYVKPIKLRPEVEWLAVETARLCKLDIAGVDILIDQDSYKICEINSSPGFQGFELATGVDVAETMLTFCQVRSGVYKQSQEFDLKKKKIVTVPVEAEMLLVGTHSEKKLDDNTSTGEVSPTTSEGENQFK